MNIYWNNNNNICYLKKPKSPMKKKTLVNLTIQNDKKSTIAIPWQVYTKTFVRVVCSASFEKKKHYKML